MDEFIGSTLIVGATEMGLLADTSTSSLDSAAGVTFLALKKIGIDTMRVLAPVAEPRSLALQTELVGFIHKSTAGALDAVMGTGKICTVPRMVAASATSRTAFDSEGTEEVEMTQSDDTRPLVLS